MSKNVLVFVAAALALGATQLSAQDGYQIVVNAANPVSQLTADQVSLIFMKKVARWDSGQPVVAVDQKADAPVRAGFSEAVHGKPVSAIKTYWQRQVFSGRGVPLAEKDSDAEVLLFVEQNPNAIGYVSAGATIGGNVKVLKVSA